jgi:hypothetical protein
LSANISRGLASGIGKEKLDVHDRFAQQTLKIYVADRQPMCELLVIQHGRRAEAAMRWSVESKVEQYRRKSRLQSCARNHSSAASEHRRASGAAIVSGFSAAAGASASNRLDGCTARRHAGDRHSSQADVGGAPGGAEPGGRGGA